MTAMAILEKKSHQFSQQTIKAQEEKQQAAKNIKQNQLINLAGD